MNITTLIKLAEDGDAEAQFKLALCFEKGAGCEQDEQKALKLYRRAADQSHAESEYKLGFYYESVGEKGSACDLCSLCLSSAWN